MESRSRRESPPAVVPVAPVLRDGDLLTDLVLLLRLVARRSLSLSDDDDDEELDDVDEDELELDREPELRDDELLSDELNTIVQ